MELLQTILVYITVAIALAYVVYKFFLPKTIFSGKKNSIKSCGQDDCGCH